MTPQQQRIALAEWDEPQHKWEVFEDIFIGATAPYRKDVGYRYPAHSGWILAKQYPSDLSAVRSIFDKLTTLQKRNVITSFLRIPYACETFTVDDVIKLAGITAEQLSEHVCRTLFPERWED